VPTRRQPLHEPALDVEETRLVVLDHVLILSNKLYANDISIIGRLRSEAGKQINQLRLNSGSAMLRAPRPGGFATPGRDLPQRTA
jgi:hypothetical protein